MKIQLGNKDFTTWKGVLFTKKLYKKTCRTLTNSRSLKFCLLLKLNLKINLIITNLK